MTGSEPLARSHGSYGPHGRRHRSSPGELAPAQHDISADLGRPASMSLADVSATGLAQPGSGRAQKAESARQPRQAQRQSEAGQHSRLHQRSESPVKRRRWTLTGVSIRHQGCQCRTHDAFTCLGYLYEMQGGWHAWAWGQHLNGFPRE